MGCISEPQKSNHDSNYLENKPNIDQNALSRQLAVYGHETQGKLMAMKVFVHGISGVHILKYSLA